MRLGSSGTVSLNLTIEMLKASQMPKLFVHIYCVCINLKQITIICTDCTIELSLGSLPGFSVETVFLAINFYYPEIHNNYIAKLPKHQTVYFNQNHSSFN